MRSRAVSLPSPPPPLLLVVALAGVVWCLVGGAAAQAGDASGDAERPRAARTAPQDAARLRTYLAKLAHELELAGRPRLGKRAPWWMTRALGGGPSGPVFAPASASAGFAAAPAVPAAAASSPGAASSLGAPPFGVGTGAAAPGGAFPSVYDWLYQYDE